MRPEDVGKWSPELWLAVALVAVGGAVGAVAWRHAQEPPAVGAWAPMSWEKRLDAVRGAWDAEPRTALGCPTVAALDAELPELRGVHAEERDYVGRVMGRPCR